MSAGPLPKRGATGATGAAGAVGPAVSYAWTVDLSTAALHAIGAVATYTWTSGVLPAGARAAGYALQGTTINAGMAEVHYAAGTDAVPTAFLDSSLPASTVAATSDIITGAGTDSTVAYGMRINGRRWSLTVTLGSGTFLDVIASSLFVDAFYFIPSVQA